MVYRSTGHVVSKLGAQYQICRQHNLRILQKARIINIDAQDAQDKQDERFLHRKPARAMVRWGIADAQEYKLAVS